MTERRYRDMDDDERVEFLADTIIMLDKINAMLLPPRLKPAMYAVWAMARAYDSMHNLRTFYEIDREACLDEITRRGVAFLANLTETTEAIPEDVPADMVVGARCQVTEMTRHVCAPKYRPVLAQVIERLFQDSAKKGIH